MEKRNVNFDKNIKMFLFGYTLNNVYESALISFTNTRTFNTLHYLVRERDIYTYTMHAYDNIIYVIVNHI